MRTIGFRLGLLIFGCLLIAFAACGGVIYALHITDRTIDRALDAQRRLDLLTEMSGRIQQYGLVAIASVEDPQMRTTRLKETEDSVYTSITAFEPEIAKAISEADLPNNVNAMAARAKPLEQVRAGFRVLVRQVNEAFAQPEPQARSDTIRGAFNGFATMTGPYLFFLMAADRRGVEAERDESRTISKTLTDAAIIFVAIAPRRRRHHVPPAVTADPLGGRGDPRCRHRDRPGQTRRPAARAQPRRTRAARGRLQPDDGATAAGRASRDRRPPCAGNHDCGSHRRSDVRQREAERDRPQPPSLFSPTSATNSGRL